MGDAKSWPGSPLQLRVEFRGATVTSDAGLLLPRELDERLGLDALIERHLTDPRTGHNRQFPVADLVARRQSSGGGGGPTRHPNEAPPLVSVGACFGDAD